jgi:hypothetical protein
MAGYPGSFALSMAFASHSLPSRFSFSHRASFSRIERGFV